MRWCLPCCLPGCRRPRAARSWIAARRSRRNACSKWGLRVQALRTALERWRCLPAIAVGIQVAGEEGATPLVEPRGSLPPLPRVNVAVTVTGVECAHRDARRHDEGKHACDAARRS